MYSFENNFSSEVNDVLITYIKKEKTLNDRMMSVFGENFGMEELIKDKLALVRFISLGMEYVLFEELVKWMPFGDAEWSKFLDVSLKTFQRYRMERRSFKSSHTEKIMELSEVYAIGIDIFKDSQKFRIWLDTPNFALGKMKPIDLLRDSYGKELVSGELVRIDEGIFA